VDAYRTDLAFVHDDGYGAIARAAAERLLAEFESRGLSGGLTVDLGCGSGILAERLTAAGRAVLGIDISPAMIALAERRAPRARFRCGSLLDADIPPCIAVTATGECLNYLFDPHNSPAALERLFERIYRSLHPGGLLLFDVAEPARRAAGPLRRFALSGEWATLVESLDDPDPALLVRRITTFRKAGDLYRRDDETHVQRLYPRGELAAALRALGFRVRILAGYGRERFAPGVAGILARKP
jgi:SAM-dependent methyltransferase